MSDIAPGTMQRPWLAFLRHRRWWTWNVNPIGPGQVLTTEDDAFRFVTEDGLFVFVTEGT